VQSDMTIDADTHVIETEHTWDYLEGPERRFRPIPIEATDEAVTRQFWLIEDRLSPRRQNIGHDTTEATRELRDVSARLQDMDRLGVSIQVLYPTVFLRPVTTNPDAEIAVCRSYNRWLADVWSKAAGRLRWMVVLPLMSMEESLRELRWAKGNGACGIFMRGFEGGRRPADPYFFPLFEEASRLNLPLAFHAGVGSLTLHDMFGEEPFSKFKFAVINAFWSLVYNGIPQKFPKLRLGFIEASSGWVPYLMTHLAATLRNRRYELPPDLLRTARLYLTCQLDDDLPYIVQKVGDDNLLCGSDYGHADTSSELEVFQHLGARQDLNETTIHKIRDDNARVFYDIAPA
jgi:uncharacterized protein